MQTEIKKQNERTSIGKKRQGKIKMKENEQKSIKKQKTL